MVSWRGVSRYSNSSGTGRCDERTVTVGRLVSFVSAFSKTSVGPRVALMSRNWARSSTSSGICHATPRSRSA